MAAAALVDPETVASAARLPPAGAADAQPTMANASDAASARVRCVLSTLLDTTRFAAGGVDDRHRTAQNLLVRWRLVAVAAPLGLFMLAGCGSAAPSSSGGTPPSAGGTAAGGAATTPSASQNSPAVTVSTCSLLSASQVTALLGQQAPNPGIEHVYDGNYKSCTWYGSSSANSAAVAVNICDCATNAGFNDGATFGTRAPYPGLGDSATFSSNGSGGAFAAEMQAVKGRVAVDVTMQGPVDPSSVKATMADDVAQILPQFH